MVTLHDSEDYRFVVVGAMGIVSSYKPRTTRGNVQTMVYLQKNTMATVHFPVLPTRDGKIIIGGSKYGLFRGFGNWPADGCSTCAWGSHRVYTCLMFVRPILCRL